MSLHFPRLFANFFVTFSRRSGSPAGGAPAAAGFQPAGSGTTRPRVASTTSDGSAEARPRNGPVKPRISRQASAPSGSPQ
jgi:hypothetical protein